MVREVRTLEDPRLPAHWFRVESEDKGQRFPSFRPSKKQLSPELHAAVRSITCRMFGGVSTFFGTAAGRATSNSVFHRTRPTVSSSNWRRRGSHKRRRTRADSRGVGSGRTARADKEHGVGFSTPYDAYARSLEIDNEQNVMKRRSVPNAPLLASIPVKNRRRRLTK